MNIKTKDVCAIGLGIALFVTLSMCLRVPVFENYYICLGYVVMTVYLHCFGIAGGTIVGVVGTVVYCLLINGLRGMPGWALGNFVIGVLIGGWFGISRNIQNKFLLKFATIGVVILATALGILGAKSLTEVALYAQPFAARIASNMPAFVADVVVLLTSLPVCRIVCKHTKTKER